MACNSLQDQELIQQKLQPSSLFEKKASFRALAVIQKNASELRQAQSSLMLLADEASLKTNSKEALNYMIDNLDLMYQTIALIIEAEKKSCVIPQIEDWIRIIIECADFYQKFGEPENFRLAQSLLGFWQTEACAKVFAIPEQIEHLKKHTHLYDNNLETIYNRMLLIAIAHQKLHEEIFHFLDTPGEKSSILTNIFYSGDDVQNRFLEKVNREEILEYRHLICSLSGAQLLPIVFYSEKTLNIFLQKAYLRDITLDSLNRIVLQSVLLREKYRASCGISAIDELMREINKPEYKEKLNPVVNFYLETSPKNISKIRILFPFLEEGVMKVTEKRLILLSDIPKIIYFPTRRSYEQTCMKIEENSDDPICKTLLGLLQTCAKFTLDDYSPLLEPVIERKSSEGSAGFFVSTKVAPKKEVDTWLGGLEGCVAQGTASFTEVSESQKQGRKCCACTLI